MLGGMAHLLIVEDDELLRDALSAQLTMAGHTVTPVADGAQAQSLLDSTRCDAVILDLGLPKVHGMEVLRWIRQRLAALPVLVLTALDGLDDRVAGLNAGADDYLTKPFDFPELEARLHALMRRGRPPARAAASVGQLSFDRAARRASVRGAALELSPREWLLLDLLLTEQDRVVSKQRITQAWAQDGGDGGGGSIEVYIHRLRRKLEHSGLTIRTVRGLGYLLEHEAAQA